MLPRHARRNRLDAGAVVGLVADEQRGDEQDGSAHGGAEIFIRKDEPCALFKSVQADTEQHTDQAKNNGKETGIESAF